MTRGVVRWGVLGAAGINEALIPGLRAASNAALYAMASRRADVARREARRWGAAAAYSSYDGLLDDPGVDAVYIPLPNHMHAEWTVRSLEAGKHVLCEKPLVLSMAEMDRIEDAAGRAGRLVLEAFMYRFHPRWARARQLLAEGAIGDPRIVRVGFAFRAYPETYNIRFDPAVGGGIIWDMGCYLTSMARDLFQAEPETILATGHRRRGAEVETSVEAILRFPGGRAAVTHSSFDYPNPYSQVEVVGSNGWISMPGTGMRNEPFTRLLWHRADDEVFIGGAEPAVESFAYADPYRLEIEHLSECILTGRGPRYSLNDSKANVRALLAIFRSVNDGRETPVLEAKEPA